MKRNFKSLVMSAVSVIVLIFGLGIVSYAATEAEPNDGTNTATQISVDELHQGSLSSGSDIDWYKFTTNADYFNFEFVVDPSVCDTGKIGHGWNITIYKSNGVTVIKEYTGVESGFTTPNLAFEESCYVKVEAKNDYYKYAPIGCVYGINVHTTKDAYWESEKNSTNSTADNITTDEVYHGSLYKGEDIDWYRFSTDKDYFTLSFGLNESVDYDEVSSGWDVRIYLDDGVTLLKEYKNVTENFVTPELPFTGDFYINIAANNDYYMYAPIDCYYDFSVSTAEDAAWEDEFNNDSSTATDIEIANTYYGSLYKDSDIDCYVFEVESGAYSVSLKPDPNTPASKINSGWKISIFPYGSSEAIVVYNNITSNCDTFMLPFTGKFVAKIEAHNDYYKYAPIDCVYNLKVVPSSSDETWENENNNTAETANALNINTVYNANLYKGEDKDYFSFETNGKDAYELCFKREISDFVNYGWTIKVTGSESGEILRVKNVGMNNDSYSTMLIGLDKNETITVLVEATNDYHDYAPIAVTYNLTVNNHDHVYEIISTKATLTSDGEIEHICSCGDAYIETVPQISSVTLSKTNYTYDGKNKTPKVTVKDANGKVLTKNVDYKTSVASSRSGVGRYTVKVTFIGNYEGSKSVYFYIKPGKTDSVKSASQTTSAVKLSWNAVPGAAGYKVYRYSPSKKAYVEAGTTTGTTLTVKSLNAGTKYTFRVVAYGKTSAGKVYDSDSYALLKTATKTATPTLSKVASSAKGKATLTHTDVSGETGYTVYYSTSKDSGFKKYANFKADTSTCSITGLTSGKTYYFKVRTYITTDSGYVYSAWSTVKSVKVK